MKSQSLIVTAAIAIALLAGSAAFAETEPHYITPTGPTKVRQYGTVGCLTYDDFLDVIKNEFGLTIDVDGLIKARRCYAMPAGTMVEVVEREKSPSGKDMNPVCVKLVGVSGSPPCVWLLIQRLDVKID